MRRDTAAEPAPGPANSLGKRTPYFSLSLRERVGVRVVDIDSAGAGDHLQYAVDVLDDVVIPESNGAPAVGFEPNRPPAIRIFRGGMLSTIELDDETVVSTDEIGDEGSERNLTAELNSAEAAVTQARP
jgi:hypothetical protein